MVSLEDAFLLEVLIFFDPEGHFSDPVKTAKLVFLQRYNYLGGNFNPVYSGIISKLLETAAGRSCRLEMLYLPSQENMQYAKFVADSLRDADGIFLTAIRAGDAPPELEKILNAHPRTICVDNNVGSLGKFRVGTDNYAGGWLAAEKIAASGRKKPLIYGCGDTVFSYSPIFERILGFQDGCRKKLGSFNRAEQLIADEAPPEFHTIFERIKSAFESGNSFDVVFALTDQAAIHVVRALRLLGKRVPEDVAVIGFDGIAEHSPFSELSSVRQNIEEVARSSFAVMEKLLRNELVTGSVLLAPPKFKAGNTLPATI